MEFEYDILNHVGVDSDEISNETSESLKLLLIQTFC